MQILTDQRQLLHAVSWCGGALVALLMLWSCRPALPLEIRAAEANGTKALKLVAEYPRNFLKHVSPDGRLVLFYQTSTPVRTWSFDGRSIKADQPEVYDDILRVVEFKTGHEVARIRVSFSPTQTQFIRGTQHVFYNELVTNEKPHTVFKLWDFRTGVTSVCSEEDPGDFSTFVTFLDEKQAVTRVMRKGGADLLVTLTLPHCTKNVIERADSDAAPGGPLVLSADKRRLSYDAYGVGPQPIIIRDAATMAVIKRLHPPQGMLFGRHAYTPDGRFLLVVASTTSPDTPETRRFLLSYDGDHYEPIRRIEATRWKALAPKAGRWTSSEMPPTMAISPNGRMIAIPYTEERRQLLGTDEQAFVGLYNLETGEEVARASHPKLRARRSDPFQAKVNRLAFTPDGKHLLSSTNDTRVWRIESGSVK